MNPYTQYVTPTGGQGTTDAFADVLFVTGDGLDRFVRAITSGPLSLQLVNLDGANSLSYQILGSNEHTLADTRWVSVVASTALAANTTTSEAIDVGRFLFYKLQIKATTPGSQASLLAAVAAKRV